MNLGEFHQNVADWLKRGDALEQAIPGLVRLAARFLERNYKFLYMEKFLTTTLQAGDRYLSFPSTRIKEIDLFRWVDEDNQYSYLRRINPKDQTGVEQGDNGYPVGYWRNGASGLVVSGTYTSALSAELLVSELTSWPDADNATHWLIDNGEDVLLAQSLLYAALFLRDANMAAGYKAMRDEGLKTLIDEDIESRHSNSEEVMRYQP